MATPSQEPAIITVDSVPALITLLDDCAALPVNPPSLYLDIEGVNLSRHGSVSIVTLFIQPKNKVYLVDIHIMGDKAFSTANQAGTSLKAVLESDNIPKVFFDVRNDSDALFSHFKICLTGIQDIQLMEMATRDYSRERVKGLAQCIEQDSGMDQVLSKKWKEVKDRGRNLFAPEKGGDYQVFNQRPMRLDIVTYCAQDVTFLPKLWSVYDAKLKSPEHAGWQYMVDKATVDRITDSQSSGYDPHGPHRKYGPWTTHYSGKR